MTDETRGRLTVVVSTSWRPTYEAVERATVLTVTVWPANDLANVKAAPEWVEVNGRRFYSKRRLASERGAATLNNGVLEVAVPYEVPAGQERGARA